MAAAGPGALARRHAARRQQGRRRLAVATGSATLVLAGLGPLAPPLHRGVAEADALASGATIEVTTRPLRATGPWSRWAPAVAWCESRNRTTIVNPSSGSGGTYQITPSTWDGYSGYLRADEAPPAVQETFARVLYERRGLQPWLASRTCWQPIVDAGGAIPTTG